MRAPFPAALAIVASLALAGCQPAADKPEPVRPVLTKVLTLEAAPTVRFAGEVAPRYQTDLSFQVFGRVIERSVNVGDTITTGQQIAQLDSTSQQLNVRAAEANLASAEAQLNNLLAVEQRQADLLERGTISDIVYETAQQASRSGAAAVAQARAQLDKAREQLNYTVLRADAEAVVTAVGVEPGQTIGVGQVVATVVRPDEREAVISVPEAFATDLKVGDRFDIVKQLDPAIVAVGSVREIAPQADPNTRSFEVRIALNGASASFTIGSTITASLAHAEPDQLVLPRSAVLDRDGATSAWVVDPKTQTVSQQSVTTADRDEATVEVTSGLSAGDIVVVAGVHSLEDGQAVRIDEGQM